MWKQFAATAVVLERYQTDDLDELRGVARRLPFAGAAFTAGSVTLAGLPPTIGFVPEWFPLEALLQQFRLPGLPFKLTLALRTAGCVALAIVTPLEIRVIARGLNAIEPAATLRGALKGPWVLQPVFANFSILAPTWLWIIMPGPRLGR